MKTIVVSRDTIGDKQSLGVCYVFDEDNELVFRSECIERGWVNNERDVSCIPEGRYPVKLEHSPKFRKDLWEIYEVPNRNECKFHAANYARQLNGCIALGQKRLDIDSDGYNDITNSRNTMKAFHEAFGDDTEAVLVVQNITDIIA